MACDLRKIIEPSMKNGQSKYCLTVWQIHGTGIYFETSNHVIWQAVPQQTTLDVHIVYQISQFTKICPLMLRERESHNNDVIHLSKLLKLGL